MTISDFWGLPQSNPKSNPTSDSLTWKVTQPGEKVTFRVTFRVALGGRPEKSLFSHFRVTLNVSGSRGFWEVSIFSTLPSPGGHVWVESCDWSRHYRGVPGPSGPKCRESIENVFPGLSARSAKTVPKSSEKSLKLRSQGPPTEVKIRKREHDIFGVKKMPFWGPPWNRLNGLFGHLISSLNKDLVLREEIRCPKKAHLNGSKWTPRKGIVWPQKCHFPVFQFWPL